MTLTPAKKIENIKDLIFDYCDDEHPSYLLTLLSMATKEILWELGRQTDKDPMGLMETYCKGLMETTIEREKEKRARMN